MAVAGVLVQTKAGKGEKVAALLKGFPGTSINEVVDNCQVVTVIEGEISLVERITSQFVREMEDVLGAYPVYINYEDEVLGSAS
ncbi:hypothetical protein SY88_18230 [Clostridiales bacterium PH28_bin88]|nr:hypothetical protein SY88_18230 [Clostridiales bacterium PH28_bin88]